jgi:hypothetical protein
VVQWTASGAQHLTAEAGNVDHDRGVVERVEVDQLVERAIHRRQTGGVPSGCDE